jgi:hypothetical protein
MLLLNRLTIIADIENPCHDWKSSKVHTPCWTFTDWGNNPIGITSFPVGASPNKINSQSRERIMCDNNFEYYAALCWLTQIIFREIWVFDLRVKVWFWLELYNMLEHIFLKNKMASFWTKLFIYMFPTYIQAGRA